MTIGDCPVCGKPMTVGSATRGDYIRSMTDEELGAWLGEMIFPECVCCPADEVGWCKTCHENWVKWLKGDAGEEMKIRGVENG